MAKIKEREVGEIFSLGDTEVQVREAIYGCEGCVLNHTNCELSKDVTGPCAGTDRKDVKNVVFVWHKDKEKKDDAVNHPSHYTSDPSGVECIQITRHRDFNIGNAIKYLWRAGLKKEPSMDEIDKEIEDLEKAIFYINDKIKLLKNKKK